MKVPIASIKIGKRHRKEMGDLHASHTPGPWQFSNRNWLDEVDPHGNLYITGNHGDGSCTAVARVEGNATAGAIPLANARLIAAAPELLAACQACVDQLSASSVCDVVIQKDQQPSHGHVAIVLPVEQWRTLLEVMDWTRKVLDSSQAGENTSRFLAALAEAERQLAERTKGR